ncbi:hypothetical protein RRG08_054577 [Elysia crispata]|uniref:Uncharacterized protein n=1 Tax=Elysia crispata TaxID=231223 RepID=A0AAE1B2X3_9GAST|nr:hypothetical protein RRG08_054577 [Elysia crispata]
MPRLSADKRNRASYMIEEENPIDWWRYGYTVIRDDIELLLQLEAALHHEWAAILQAFFQSLIRSMRRRKIACNNAHGGHIRYINIAIHFNNFAVIVKDLKLTLMFQRCRPGGANFEASADEPSTRGFS